MRLQIENHDGKWKAKKKWSNGEGFFYCNWIQRDGKILGCDGKLMLAIDPKTGKLLGQWRGYSESNLVAIGNTLAVLDGDGALSQITLREYHLHVIAKHQVMKQRCWTPPTYSDGVLFCRGGNELHCIESNKSGSRDRELASVRVRRPLLKMKSLDASKLAIPSLPDDPIDAILAGYRENGPDGGWEVYLKHREENPDVLLMDDRSELVEMALEQGLMQMAKQLVQHIRADIQVDDAMRNQLESLEQRVNRKPSSKKILGDNGLTYIEFAILNGTKKVIQAYVKGPSKHPFSYGLPLRPGVERLEKWPVGTKLYRTHNNIRQDVLLSIEEGNAGKVLTIK